MTGKSPTRCGNQSPPAHTSLGMPRSGAVRFGDPFFRTPNLDRVRFGLSGRTPNRIGVRCGSGAVRVYSHPGPGPDPEPQKTAIIGNLAYVIAPNSRSQPVVHRKSRTSTTLCGRSDKIDLFLLCYGYLSKIKATKGTGQGKEGQESGRAVLQAVEGGSRCGCGRSHFCSWICRPRVCCAVCSWVCVIGSSLGSWVGVVVGVVHGCVVTWLLRN